MVLDSIDYVIFTASVLVSAGVSIYYRFTGGKQKTNKEYLLGSKDQKVIPVAFSLVANFTSSISILGYTSEVYSFGTHFFGINVAYLLSTPIAAAFYLPVLFKNDTISVYEYFEKRFGKLTRFLASTAFTIQMILYMGIVHYAPAIAIEAVSGIPKIMSILVVGLICIGYSVIGGLKAVIVNDLIQTLLMFAAVCALIIVNVLDAGGFTNIWNAAEAHHRIQFSNFNIDPTERHSWWTVIIGGFFTHITVYSINQAQVQRYVAMPSYKKAAAALLISCPILVLFMSLLCIAGLSIFYYYRDCDPITEGRIVLSDQIVPLYVMDRLNHIPGLTGLFIAGIFSASLSTVSAAVNSLAAVTLEDYIKPLYRWRYQKDLETHNANISKVLALFYGCLCLIVAMLVRNYESLIQACIVVFGMIGGPMFGLLTVGVMFPFVNQFGGIIGFFVGLVSSFVLGFGPKPKLEPLPMSTTGCKNTIYSALQHTISRMSTELYEKQIEYYYIFKISYLYYIVISFLITVILSVTMSLFYDDSETEVDADLFTPIVSKHLKKRRARDETIYMCDVKKLEELDTF